MLRNIKYNTRIVHSEVLFSLMYAFGTADQKAYCAAILQLCKLTQLDRRTMQKWFDSAVADSGRPWQEVYDLVVGLLASGETLANCYIRVLAMVDDEGGVNE
jgi:hypothetical protein